MYVYVCMYICMYAPLRNSYIHAYIHTDDSKKLLAENSGEKPEPPAEPKEKVSIGQVIELLKKKEYRTKLVACGMYVCI